MSFPMIYQQGTSTGTIQAISYGGDAGLIGTGGKTKSQSFLAQKATPPIQPEFSLSEVFASFFIFLLITVVILVLGLNGLGWIFTFLFGVVAYSLLVFFIYNRYKKVEKEKIPYQRLLTIWQNSWMCLKCGNGWRLNPLKNK